MLRFNRKSESEEWLTSRHRQRPDTAILCHERLQHPTGPQRLRFLAHWIAESLTHGMPALMWVTEWGIWPSGENWHLYYRLRQSYGDLRLLEEAPGHFFLAHEVEDLASFLQLAMLNGWGGYVLTEADYVNLFFSHDGFVEFFADRDENLSDVRQLWRNENFTTL